MNKINLGVIFGGKSNEYEVSLISTCCVLKNIDLNKYIIHKIGITKEGNTFLYQGSIDNIQNNNWINDYDNLRPCAFSTTEFKGIYAINEQTNTFDKIGIDVIFPVIHGKNCEDGTFSGFLSTCNIPYVGCDTLSSSCCMDKEVTHIILEKANIKMARYKAIMFNDYNSSTTRKDAFIKECEALLKYPMFVKPSNSGSSVAVSKAHNLDELFKAIDLAFMHDKKVIVEETIIGKEVECAVLGDLEPKASLVGDIECCDEWYNYEAKYLDDKTVTNIPARISKSSTQKVRDISVAAFKALGCSGFSRVDFFVNEDTVTLNEINTIPGFTNISMYPKLWIHTGLDYNLLIDELIDLALKKGESI